MPSSLSRYSSAPKTKIIFQFLWGILEGRPNRARPSQPQAKLGSAYSFMLKYSKITVWLDFFITLLTTVWDLLASVKIVIVAKKKSAPTTTESRSQSILWDIVLFTFFIIFVHKTKSKESEPQNKFKFRAKNLSFTYQSTYLILERQD